MPLTRLHHWQDLAFPEFLKARRDMPFAWGTNDCALFAADGIQAITGEDIAADFRGKYSTQAGAFALIQSLTGGATIADAAAYCANKAGMPALQYPLMAQRGDLVIVKNASATGADAEIAGLLHSSGRHVAAVGESGLLRIDVLDPSGNSNLVRAWRV